MTPSHNIQIFGEFLAEIPVSHDYLTLNFSPTSETRKRCWEHNGISADFLGDYFAAFFPGDPTAKNKINRKNTVKSIVSYIANELLENAVKYSDRTANLPISITLYLYEEELIFFVTNYAHETTIKKYQKFITELLDSDPDEFYTRQMEKTALGNGESQLGLLTMVNDYSAHLGWKFDHLHHDSEIVHVSVMARFDI
ncbi:ATP-binding protein [[Phormidium ambiguum] IAM M-71]|uniref:ATP-binding protein n=1 Tax=[Phormidium ambiguum] IAM M-71 TaxID=454136 RepID=A0A1U7IN42_9CYAN|nr:ATP-binding protein [Phormidium ambiguum]OKH38768.1 ATP-binding protein [Phormidium ambiguum IAM M-71]